MLITLSVTTIFLTLTLNFVTYSPINKSKSFDISITRRSYQVKINDFLFQKYNLDNVQPVFKIKPIVTEELVNTRTGDANKIIFWPTKELPSYKRLGAYINYKGYRCDKNGRLIHRLVMSKHLRRKLRPGEVVHHIDGNKLNNRIKNLMLFPNQDEHDKYHRGCLRKYGDWYGIPTWRKNYIKIFEYA